MAAEAYDDDEQWAEFALNFCIRCGRQFSDMRPSWSWTGMGEDANWHEECLVEHLAAGS